MVELADHGAVAAFAREGADMAFDQHGLVPRPAPPIGRLPLKARMVDHFARPVNVFRLEVRRRVRDVDPVIDAEFVAGTGFYSRNIDGEPAIAAARHRLRLV